MGKMVEGVFAINKPCGLSSAQVIRDLQKHFQHSKLFEPYLSFEAAQRERVSANQNKRRRNKEIRVKIGHGGTLDPLATGVLITGIGKGTKSLQDFLLCTKTYEAVILFGASTDTYDRVGRVLRRAPYEHLTQEKVEKALGQFRGKFMQLPPLYSALKMNGKPLYEYAREGKPIPREIERRPVDVLELELLEWMEGGTHNHKAPTETAGHAEVKLADMLWEQENVVPAGGKPKKAEKRKLSESQDELVVERPASKQQKSTEEQQATMSGALDPASSTPLPEAAETEPQPEAVHESSSPEQVPAATEPTPQAENESKGPPAARIRMTVTSGFYVRSLCHDLGAAVGSAAMMAELERTRQGEFEVGKDNVFEYDDLQKGEDVWGPKIGGLLEAWETGKYGQIAKTEITEEDVSMGEAKATEGEAKATEGEAKATEGEAKAMEGEAKATEAETKATEAEAKVVEGEQTDAPKSEEKQE
ncbi:Uncharacterized protein BP5553_04136 [Venustampulla echinocandica]|uniref:tRNA pseudouridine(55) synthase n=1 Tax=Venustampulla echinocandica TaxID=2656787 RepID=A0A370TW85_9HELO|nr:Uncharacterized protein BP5553_04136 [Venustampulla echinocandica]RDL39796.1 Uncharacterized protein BP5553_04136 [Venustampulla echinocandica]